jgi:hypothetical protein
VHTGAGRAAVGRNPAGGFAEKTVLATFSQENYNKVVRKLPVPEQLRPKDAEFVA